MNQTTHYILGIYQLSLLVRDTLGYVAPERDDKLVAATYKQRAQNFKSLMAEGSPFAGFLKANAEKAEKISSNFNDFITEIYSDQSRIIRVVGEKVEVDHSQHLRVYEMVIGIQQTLEDILQGYLHHARTNGTSEEAMEQAVYLNEYYYRALAHYTILNDLFKLFKEYGEAMRSAQGAENPVAKFISSDIAKLVGYINFQEKHNKVTETRYKESTDLVKAFVEYIAGKRKLPEGKDFPTVFAETNDFVFKTLQEAEVKWRDVFIPLFNEYLKTIPTPTADTPKEEELS